MRLMAFKESLRQILLGHEQSFPTIFIWKVQIFLFGHTWNMFSLEINNKNIMKAFQTFHLKLQS